MKTKLSVYATSDYSKFKRLEGNRKVAILHVEKLKAFFKNSNFIPPIIVNESYEIIDGQHRLEAAKQLGLPICFIIVPGYSLKEAQILNAKQKEWQMTDYLKAYCDVNSHEYLKFKLFMQQFPDFGIAACEVLLTGKTSCTHQNNEKKSGTSKDNSDASLAFQQGKLEIPSYERAVEHAQNIMQVKPLYNGYSDPVFVRAMVSLFKHPRYSHQRFLRKLEQCPSMLTYCTSSSQYKLIIEDIYNRKCREKVSLCY